MRLSALKNIKVVIFAIVTISYHQLKHFLALDMNLFKIIICFIPLIFFGGHGH
jgi:hypothetical protein